MLKKSSLTLSIIFVIALLFALPANAEKSAFDFGAASMGARPLSMGKAFVAIADDTNAVFTNPAGLGLNKSWGLTTMSTQLMQKAEYRLIGAQIPTAVGNFGVGYVGLNTPAGYATTDRSSLAGATPINYGSSVIILSYGRNLSEVIKSTGTLGRLCVGANVKLYNSKFSGADASGNGTSFDVGMIAYPTDNLSVGASLANNGGQMNWDSDTTEKIPTVAKLGAGLSLFKDRLLLSGQLDFAEKRPAVLHGGAEYHVLRFLSVRAGLDQDAIDASNTVSNLTAGVGFNMNGINIDYAFRQDSLVPDNSAHYISISFMSQDPNAPVAAYIKDELPRAEIEAEKQKEIADTKQKIGDVLAGLDGIYTPLPEKIVAQEEKEEPVASIKKDFNKSIISSFDENKANSNILNFYD